MNGKPAKQITVYRTKQIYTVLNEDPQNYYARNQARPDIEPYILFRKENENKDYQVRKFLSEEM